jgi:hypothetical protein
LHSAEEKARDAKRMVDLDQIAKAIDIYRDDYGANPSPTTEGSEDGFHFYGWPGVWESASWTTITDPPIPFLPFLVPNYLSQAPIDPVNWSMPDEADWFAHYSYWYMVDEQGLLCQDFPGYAYLFFNYESAGHNHGEPLPNCTVPSPLEFIVQHGYMRVFPPS